MACPPRLALGVLALLASVLCVRAQKCSTACKQTYADGSAAKCPMAKCAGPAKGCIACHSGNLDNVRCKNSAAAVCDKTPNCCFQAICGIRLCPQRTLAQVCSETLNNCYGELQRCQCKAAFAACDRVLFMESCPLQIGGCAAMDFSGCKGLSGPARGTARGSSSADELEPTYFGISALGVVVAVAVAVVAVVVFSCGKKAATASPQSVVVQQQGEPVLQATVVER